MTTTTIHVQIDKEIEDQAAETLAALGLSVSDAVRTLLTRIATEKALPFELKVPNATTLEAMDEAEQGGLKSFDTVESLMADLNASD
jgi:DNA-damage-inducible protein J